MNVTTAKRDGRPDLSAIFSPDYPTARARFRARAEALGLALEAHAIDARGPAGEDLTVDVAVGGDPDAAGALVVSSGLHGVEGYFGAAVQLAMMEQGGIVRSLPSGVSLVLLHALNPYGFAWLRRVDEENVDLNRNFLRDGEVYRGSPDLYAAYERLINAPHPPRPFDLFRIRTLLPVIRHGRPAMKQAIAGGQFDFPRGLFFGGHRPSAAHRIVAGNLGRWIGEARRVVHLDFHTGLGRWGTYQLLLDPEIPPGRFDWLRSRFGETVRDCDPVGGIAYQTRGDLGAWCRSAFPDRDYDLLCAEFGTYPPVRVLEALRAENQAHFWCRPGDAATARARRGLLDVFVPASPSWRGHVVAQGLEIIGRGIAACRDGPEPGRTS
jgi:hypothetical protein